MQYQHINRQGKGGASSGPLQGFDLLGVLLLCRLELPGQRLQGRRQLPL